MAGALTAAVIKATAINPLAVADYRDPHRRIGANPMPPMRNCWPIWEVNPTGTTTAASPATAPMPSPVRLPVLRQPDPRHALGRSTPCEARCARPPGCLGGLRGPRRWRRPWVLAGLQPRAGRRPEPATAIQSRSERGWPATEIAACAREIRAGAVLEQRPQPRRSTRCSRRRPMPGSTAKPNQPQRAEAGAGRRLRTASCTELLPLPARNWRALGALRRRPSPGTTQKST